MSLKLYNTMTRSLEDFVPLHDTVVNLYTCGLTVYSQPHIGNWVAYIYWDTLVRALKSNGYSVNHVQNITDVGHLTSDEDAGEDKMLKSALKEGTTAWQVADKYIAIAEDEAYKQLDLLRPTHMPRATDYIAQQTAFVQELEQKGFTYTIADGVYFDTSKLDDYGKLARLDIDGLQFGARVADTGKRNPTDFALWKFSPEGEQRDMEWDNPFATDSRKGFPGWHLECSVLAHEFLGDTLDIHTGGIDHIPVHHTNEIAQSESLTGQPFANFWVHANHIKVDGTKMSKSLGNIYTLQDIKDHGFSLDAFKLMILSKHYRTEGNFTWEILESAANRLKSYQAMADMLHQPLAAAPKLDRYTHIANIREQLQNDLDTPMALTLLSAFSDDISTNSIHADEVEPFKAYLSELDDLLGLHLSTRSDITEEQKNIVRQRQQIRNDRDWEKSDVLRDVLKEQGILIRDTPLGQMWERL